MVDSLKFRVYDGAGLVGFERYEFKGNPEQQRRELLVDATSAPDWTIVASAGTVSSMATAAAGLLDAQERYETSQAVDAQNRILRLVSPDGSVTHSSYNKAGLLESVEVQHRSDTAPRDIVVSNLDTNEKGQRIRVVYGTGNQGDARSGTTTHLHYDPETFRLRQQVTTRSSDNAVLQDHRYIYDPVGNITRIEDEAQADVYYRNTLVEAANTYRYDALYRLTEATGREHVAQGNVQPRHREPWEDAGPLPSDGQAMRAYTQQYDYDEVGKLLQMRHRVNDSQDQWTRTYTYAEDSNRLLETSAPSGQTGTDSYSYDGHEEFE